MTYEVRLTAPAERDLRRLTRDVQQRVAERIRTLASDPRPPGAIAVKGQPRDNYRIRVGDLRVGYEVHDASRTVLVWQIGDRGRFYERAIRRR